MIQTELIKAVGVTAELTGTVLSEPAAEVMCEDLSRFPLHQVLVALNRCRKELKGRLTIADIISRLDDGRPTPEQAWSMIPMDEKNSVVWTEEMAEAYGSACPLLNNGDKIAARMAFKETYSLLIIKARDDAKPVKWIPSFGTDKAGREDVVIDAVEKKRLSYDRAIELIPYSERLIQYTETPQLENQKKVKALIYQVTNKPNKSTEHKIIDDENEVQKQLEEYYKNTELADGES